MISARLALLVVLLFSSRVSLASPAATPSPTPLPGNVREVCGTGGVLNLRSGPSTSAKVLETLPDEFDVVVLATHGSGAWLKVRDEAGRTGWVARRFTCADDQREAAVGPWTNPAPGACVTSKFGPRKSPCAGCSKNHRGIDMGACNTPIGAGAAGRVIASKFDRKGGNVVAVDHGAGVVSYYMHLKTRDVDVGECVAPGTKVGIAGRTGAASTGCHLHFEVRQNGKSIDPAPLIAVSGPPKPRS